VSGDTGRVALAVPVITATYKATHTLVNIRNVPLSTCRTSDRPEPCWHCPPSGTTLA
jgi:hypothetical protein